MACWIPVYPFDVIKTNLQNTQGGNEESMSFLGTARQLVDTYGYGVFVDGLTPKLARAAVNHAVTFYVYGSLYNRLN